jgi:tape measure domain-containing protein
MSGLKVELDLDDGEFTSGMIRAGESVAQFQSRVGGAITSISKMEDTSRSFLGTLRDVTVVLGLTHQALGMVESVTTSWVHEILNVNAEFERMVTIMKSLSTADNPLKEATATVTDLRNMAKEVPFSLNSIHLAFIRLKTGGFDAETGVRALTDAVAAFGGGDAELNRASLAIQEMGGKGVVQMKELRNQLMMAVPNAAQMMARSVGESYGQMMSDIHSGTVDAKTTVQGFFLEVERSFGGAAQRQMQTFNGQLTNTIKLLQTIAIENVGKPLDSEGAANANGFFQTVKQQVVDFNDFLSSGTAKGLGDMLGSALTTVTLDIREAIEWVVKFREEIYAAGEAFAVGFGIKLLAGGILGLANGLENVGTQLTFIKAQWMAATGVVESNSVTAAIKRQTAALMEAALAKETSEIAWQKSAASQVIAADMRNLAETQPVAAVRSPAQQAALEMAALNAEKAVRSEMVAAELIGLASIEAAENRVSAARIIAEAARTTADSAGRRTHLQQANLDMAAERAEQTLHREMASLTTVQLNAEAAAEDRVAAARVRAAEAQRVADAAPETVVRTGVEQAELDLAAIRAESSAKRDLRSAEAAAAGLAAAEVNRAAVVAEEGVGSLGRAGANFMAFLPMMATGLGAIAIAAPLAGLAIGAIAEYFDVFNTKAKEAWENAEHFGVASMMDAHAGDNFVDQQQRKLDSLSKLKEFYDRGYDQPSARAQFSGSGDFERARNANDAALDAQGDAMKKIRAEQEAHYAEGAEGDAKTSAKPTVTAMNAAELKNQREYTKQAIADQEEYTKKFVAFASEKKSTSELQANYSEMVQTRDLEYYDKQIASLREVQAEAQKAADTGSDKDKAGAIESQAVMEGKISEYLKQQVQMRQQIMHLIKDAKPIDDVAVIGKATTELEKLKESIGGYKAGIQGADYEAEKLAETWARMEKPEDSDFVRNLIAQIKQAKTEADDLNKIMTGGDKLIKAYDDNTEKNLAKIDENENGEKSGTDRINIQRDQGKFPGYGGSSTMAQHLNEMRIAAQSNVSAANSAGEALRRAFGLGEMPGILGSIAQAAAARFQIGVAVTGTARDDRMPREPAATGQVDDNDLARMRAAIKEIESSPGNYGGNYSAVGPEIKDPKSQYFGDHGYGAYQVMGGNVPAWTKEATGAAMTKEDFLASSTAQDAVFNKRWSDMLRTMSPSEAASTWFTGGKLAANGNRSDGHDTDNQYVSQFNKNMTDLRGRSAVTTQPQQVDGSEARSAASDIAVEISNTKKSLADIDKAAQEAINKKDVIADGEGGKFVAALTNWAKMNGGKPGGLGTDVNAPAYAPSRKLANDADAATKAADEHTKAVSSASSSSKGVAEQTKKLQDELAAWNAAMAHGAHTLSEGVIKAKELGDKGVADAKAAYPAGDPRIATAQSNASQLMDLAESQNSTAKLDALNKKIEAERQAVMTENQRDAEQIRVKAAGYAQDEANFHGTEQQKADFHFKILQDMAADQAAQAAKSPIGKQMQDWSDMSKGTQSLVTSTMNSSVDALTQQITTGKTNLLALRESIMKDLVSTSLKGAIGGIMGGSGLTGLLSGGASAVGGAVSPGGGASKVAGAMGGGAGKVGGQPMALQGAIGGGGLFSGLGAMFGIHHAGGMIGEHGMPTRYLDWSAFHGARRFHTGGVVGSDEVPIIAQKGEGVFTKAQMAAMTHGGSGGNRPISISNVVQVNANGGSSDQNADLAKQVGAHVERISRETVVDELMRQQRPGNMLSQ